MGVILRLLPREAICEPGFWKVSRPVPVLVKPVVERATREPGLPEHELLVLADALGAITATMTSMDRNEWRDYVFAIHWATGGSDEGLELAAAWSAQAPGWDEASRGLLDVMWQHADDAREGGITAATVFKRAAAAGWINPATITVPTADGFGLEGAAAVEIEEDLAGVEAPRAREIGPPRAYPDQGAGVVVAKSPPAPPQDYEPPAYYRDKQGMVLPTVENAVRALRDPWEVSMQIAHDTFKDEMLVAPPGTEDSWRPITDADIVRMRIKLEQRKFKAAPKELARDAAVLVAEENSFDSAQLWLEGVEQCWDGQPRVDRFLTRYFSAADDAYVRAVSRYMWTALAGRVIEPGCYAAMAPILEGAQGVGKSRGLKAMVPDAMFFGEIDFTKDETELARLLRGKLLCEINELRGLATRDQETIKAWMARTHEHWIPKFKEFATTFARRALNVGTTNRTDILADETGERRWLPLHVARVDVDGIAEVCTQLWAEGAAMFRGLVPGIGPGVAWQEAEELARAEHGAYRRADPWEGPFNDWLSRGEGLDAPEGESGGQGRARGESPFTITDVLCGAIGMQVKDMNTQTQMRAGAVLRGLGFTKGQRRVSGSSLKWMWFKE